MCSSSQSLSSVAAGKWRRRRGEGRVESSVSRKLFWRRHALVAFGKQSKGVDLVHEVSHTRPATETESHDEHPHHHECVDDVHSYPFSEDHRWFLHRVLRAHTKNQIILVKNQRTIKQNIDRFAFGVGPDERWTNGK